MRTMRRSPGASVRTPTVTQNVHRPPASDPNALLLALERLQREFDELRLREEAQVAALHRLEEQLHHAATVQRDLLPAKLPEARGLDVRVFHRSAETLGGDAYDCFRLDDQRVAFILSDATGHGVPAALLASYVHRGLRGRGVIAPDEVLRDVNADLLGRNLSECQFVAALYAVYDEHGRTVRWARGGAPYPILVRPGTAPARLVSAGPLVGACETPTFEITECSMTAGDTLLLFTDGVETLTRSANTKVAIPGPAATSKQTPFPCPTDAELAWAGELAQGSPDAAVSAIIAQSEGLARNHATVDDITVFILRCTG